MTGEPSLKDGNSLFGTIPTSNLSLSSSSFSIAYTFNLLCISYALSSYEDVAGVYYSTTM
jgi:hypothetical protein